MAKLDIANRYIDRKWSINGKVSVGRKMGRKNWISHMHNIN